jgi:thioredoxin 1
LRPRWKKSARSWPVRSKIAKIDIMENTDIAAQMGVQSIPLMVLFKNGEAVARKLGAAPKSQLKAWLESEL